MGVLHKAITYAQQLQRQAIKPGNTVIDATAGNGHDTEFLARMVGPSGRVYAFDIQKEAITKTEQRLERAQLRERVMLCHASHADMSKWVDSQVQSVMFNLGYLPGAEHSLITTPDATVDAVLQAAELLSPTGIITIVIYPGHVGGHEERVAVERVTAALPQTVFSVIRYEILNQINNPPLVVAIEKLHKAGEII